ncbi:MAG: sugar phosphate nucleotidyltransferase [Candidatus Roizmanbacteria bacterium]|nr:sugar phosphate nucleotidyltransferase [Candidatus Roizmanbacteria bacterium]
MKVIILCGGTGTRLKEETEYKPKPMVLVGGKPIIWHIMKIYAHYGFNEFILALGYKADYIKDFFLNQKAFTSDFTLETKNHNSTYFLENRHEVDDFKITFVDTGVETLPGERILLCKKYIPKDDRDFIVTYGDGVTDLNIKEVYDFHKTQKTIGTITGVHPRSKFGLVKTDINGLVKSFVEKPVLAEYVNGGFMVFKQHFFDYLEVGETEHPALKKLAKENQLSLYNHEGFWMAIDTYKELDDLNKLWEESKPWKVWA